MKRWQTAQVQVRIFATDGHSAPDTLRAWLLRSPYIYPAAKKQIFMLLPTKDSLNLGELSNMTFLVQEFSESTCTESNRGSIEYGPDPSP